MKILLAHKANIEASNTSGGTSQMIDYPES